MTTLFHIQDALAHYRGLARQALPQPRTDHGRALLDHADGLIQKGSTADPYDLEAASLKIRGLLTGLKGHKPALTATPRRRRIGHSPSIDLTAREFLGLVFERPIFPNDKTPLGVMCRQAFLFGAMEIFPEDPFFPPYISETADHWMRLVSSTHKPVDQRFQSRSRDLGRTCAQELYDRWRLGYAAGFSPKILAQTIHERRIADFTYADGWLSGYGEKFQENSSPSSYNFVDEKHDLYLDLALRMNSLKSTVDDVARDAIHDVGVLWIPTAKQRQPCLDLPN